MKKIAITDHTQVRKICKMGLAKSQRSYICLCCKVDNEGGEGQSPQNSVYVIVSTFVVALAFLHFRRPQARHQSALFLLLSIDF